jgi:hypothetical protein
VSEKEIKQYPLISLQMFHYTIGRDSKIDPPYHGKSITYRIAIPAHCSSWVWVQYGQRHQEVGIELSGMATRRPSTDRSVGFSHNRVDYRDHKKNEISDCDPDLAHL